jgi:Cu/Ag efflux protein CusF
MTALLLAMLTTALSVASSSTASWDSLASTASTASSFATVAPFAAAPPVPRAASVERHSTRGVLRAIATDRTSVTIAHEDIPNFMKAMTMPFDVFNPTLLDGLRVGQKVSFEFFESPDGRLVIDVIRPLP